MFSRRKKSHGGLFSTLFQRDETIQEEMFRFDNFDDEDDLVFEDINGDFNVPTRRVADKSKIGTVLSLVGLAAAGVGIAAVVKSKKKKTKTKQELVIKILNSKSLEELQGLVKDPKGKSKEQLVNEIKNKLK